MIERPIPPTLSLLTRVALPRTFSFVFPFYQAPPLSNNRFSNSPE